MGLLRLRRGGTQGVSPKSGPPWQRNPHPFSHRHKDDLGRSNRIKDNNYVKPVIALIQTALILSGISAMLILIEGFNVVTASMALIIQLSTLAASSYALSHKCNCSYRFIFIVFILEFIFLFGVLTLKTCARVAGTSVDVSSIKFILSPASVWTQENIGGFLSYDNVVVGLFREMMKSATILIISHTFSTTIASEKTARCLIATSSLATMPLLLAFTSYNINGLLVSAHNGKESRCTGGFDNPPTTKLEVTPSILAITVDSLRADMFTEELFPLTRKELFWEMDDVSYNEWKSHDAGASVSDQGFATLFYSIQSPARANMISYLENPKIKSWPFQTLRDNGYGIHRIRGMSEENFCFSILEFCDLYERDFDSNINGLEDELGVRRHPLEAALDWIRNRTSARAPQAPFLLNIDIQDLHFPYNKAQHEWNENKTFSFLEPEMTEEELYRAKKVISQVGKNELTALRTKLKNRVKNAALAFDGIFFEFLKAIRPLRNDLIVIFTSDHGELLIEGDGRIPAIGHNIQDSSDQQRHVPFVITGPKAVVKSLEMPSDVPTTHSGVLPSLFEALGAQLDHLWKSEINYFSYHNYKQLDHKGLVFFQDTWSDIWTVVRAGNKRIRLGSNSLVLGAKNLDTSEDLNAQEIKEIMNLAPNPHGLTWPGTKQYCSRKNSKNIAANANPYEQKNAGLVSDREDIERIKIPSFQVLAEKDVLNLKPISKPTLDVFSIGSITRFDYLHAQMSTWGQYEITRNFWGFSEKDDLYKNCSALPKEEAASIRKDCKAFRSNWAPETMGFVSVGHSITEGIHRTDIGWLCAQRRLGSVLKWMQHVYTKGGIQIPDFVLLVDDDTHVDLELFEKYLIERGQVDASEPQVHGFCAFDKAGYIAWPFAYGGFGTVITRESVKNMLQPIHCNGTARQQKDLHNEAVCESLNYNQIAEKTLFQEGMTTAELFRDYTTGDSFCMHSDWLIGYMAKYYGISKMKVDISGDGKSTTANAMHSILNWPLQCGNLTHKCDSRSPSCHRMSPTDMETRALMSYARSPEGYNQKPSLYISQANTSSFHGLQGLGTANNGKSREEISDSVRDLKLKWTPLEPITPAPKTILLASFLFGESVANSALLEIFMESAKHSGVDVLIVGWPKPSFPLPKNIQHLSVTWTQLVDLVSVKLFDGKDLPNLRAADPYKINDFKPLFGFLFEELLSKYGWWGTIDNDLLLGDIRFFLPDSTLDQFDVISPLGSNAPVFKTEDIVVENKMRTLGPFTLYRNSNTTRQLFRLAPGALVDIFDNGQPFWFDEWGQGFLFDFSISAILIAHRDELGLRLPTEYLDFGRDHDCALSKNGPRSELFAKLGSPSMLYAKKVIFCHYQDTKLEISKSIEDETFRSEVLEAGAFQVSSTQGVQILDLDAFVRFKMGAPATENANDNVLQFLGANNEEQHVRIFGVGFKKTGTTTLDKIFSRVMVYLGGSRPPEKKRNAATSEMLSNKTSTTAMALAQKHNYFQDSPWCNEPQRLYQDLALLYPTSKYILTVRDPNEWWNSVKNWCSNSQHNNRCGKGMTRYKAIFNANSTLPADFINAYKEHNEAIRHFFIDELRQPDRLLEIDLTDEMFRGGVGWAIICNFVGLSDPKCPTDDFPHANKTPKKQKLVQNLSDVGLKDKQPNFSIEGNQIGMTKILWMYWGQGLNHLELLSRDSDNKYVTDYKCVQAMIKMNPNWDVRVLSEDDTEHHAPLLHSLLQNKTLAPKLKQRMRSNTLRLEVLSRYGGVYSDTSICPFVDLDKFFEGVDFGKNYFLAKTFGLGGTPVVDFPEDTSSCHDNSVSGNGVSFRSASNFFLASARPNNPLVVEWLRTYVNHLLTLSNPKKPYYLNQCSFTQARMNNATVEEIWTLSRRQSETLQHKLCFVNYNQNLYEVQWFKDGCGLVKKPQNAVHLKRYVMSSNYLKDIDDNQANGSSLNTKRVNQSFSIQLLIERSKVSCELLRTEKRVHQHTLVTYVAVARSASTTLFALMKSLQKQQSSIAVLKHHNHECTLRDFEEIGARQVLVNLRHPLARISSGIRRRFEGHNLGFEANALLVETFMKRGAEAFVAALRNDTDPLHEFALNATIGKRKQAYMLPVSEFYLAGSLGMAEVTFLCSETLKEDYTAAVQRWGVPQLARNTKDKNLSQLSSRNATRLFSLFSKSSVDWVEQMYAADIALYKKHCPEEYSLYEKGRNDWYKEEPKVTLPNVLLIGAQKAGTTSVSKWLFSSGICKAQVFPNEPGHFSKEVHFFNNPRRRREGLNFYSKRFEHCDDQDLIMDATPNYLTHAEEVHSLYSQHTNALDKLKMIVILREPIDRELSLYNHKKHSYLGTLEENSWFSDVLSADGSVMTFEEYCTVRLKPQPSDSELRKYTGKYVDSLKRWVALFGREKLLVLSYNEVNQNPEKMMWRVQKFLGREFSSNQLQRVNTHTEAIQGVAFEKAKEISHEAREILEPLFNSKNQELYEFLDLNEGPWMEERPFPRFEMISLD